MISNSQRFVARERKLLRAFLASQLAWIALAAWLLS
jgi:hypothetical protein